MIGILCLGVALATAPAAPGTEAIDPGTRVRLTFEGDADPLLPGRSRARTRRVGRVIAVGDRTVTVAFDGHSRPVEFDQASIAGLERSLGGRPRGKGIARGAGIGLLAGVAGGVLIGLASGDDQCNRDMDVFNFCNLAFSAGEKAAIYGIALGAVGTIGGVVVGASRSSERWERGVTMFANPRVGVHLVPAGLRGAGMAVSLRF
jgi:hypothetical protein